MTRLKIETKAVVSLVLASLLFISGAAWQNARAQASGASPAGPAMAGPNGIASLPPDLPAPQARDQPAAVSSNLSYYFISGNTFTPDTGSTSTTYYPFIGCVWGMSPSVAFLAPVHLPQASVVVSMTLYTYDPTITTSISSAYFLLNNGQGFEYGPLYVDSVPHVSPYEHQDSTGGSPTTIDNQNDSYLVQWAKSGGDSAQLALCGVRLSYYAPLGATFLPVMVK
jgi:hypothetical protein